MSPESTDRDELAFTNRDELDLPEVRRRWRLLLGAEPQPDGGEAGDAGPTGLSGDDLVVDRALAAIYDRSAEDEPGQRRSAGLGASAPRVTKWLADIRHYFPTPVVQVIQSDAMERLDLSRLLQEPEFIEAVEPDIHLASLLAQLSDVLPERARSAARRVVRSVVDEIERRIAQRTVSVVASAINRSARSRRPRSADIDWNRTIAANLRHYQPDYRTVIPHRLVGFGRRRTGVQREVIVALDQSGSMAESVVFGSIFAAVLASMPTLRTHLVAFDTAVVDLTEHLADPVDVIFASQLGGGTDINTAVAYCSQLISQPSDTILVLISDLFEGGSRPELLRRMRTLHQSGVTVLVLLALADSGTPAYDHQIAGALAELGIPAFACTPDVFPEALEVAINGGDVQAWASAYAAKAAHGPE